MFWNVDWMKRVSYMDDLSAQEDTFMNDMYYVNDKFCRTTISEEKNQFEIFEIQDVEI